MKKQDSNENIAKVHGKSMPISTKQAIEISNFIRGRKVDDAIKLLEHVVKKDVAVPFRRFSGDVGHKRKIGSGRYPEKASKEIIRLLSSLNANAQFKGLNTSNLVINKICANKASSTWHYGRKMRRKMKRSNIEIIAKEEKKKEEPKKQPQEKKIRKND